MSKLNKNTFPSIDLPFVYKKQPLSGNTINGLEETEKIAATQIFHGSGAPLFWRSRASRRTRFHGRKCAIAAPILFSRPVAGSRSKRPKLSLKICRPI